MQNRNRLISFMQTFGIILVVLGHSTYQLMQAGHTPAIYKWIYTFHMPLFFFISGYLLRYSNDRKGRQLSDMPALGKDGFITKKIKRLLIPYFVISSLVFLPQDHDVGHGSPPC
jgi:fucose 4-O-acetylase-like acetyltransferase